MHEGHMDKMKGGQDRGWEVGMAGVGVSVGEKMETTLTTKKKEKNQDDDSSQMDL